MAKSIMIQGATSNAGKSFLVAALCRIFRQDGLRAAPFKSQNMALNSFITKEGLEMGRAQVMQAEAAGIEPSVRMNPVLLKPTGNSSSQVIVNGRVRADLTARGYYAMKKELIPEIMEAYRSLAEEYDVIVLEGAGSPAEINLKKDDIVNMGMAKMAGAPVLLCGDIDPGGVFASLYGTVALLEPDERERVKGLIINKFRGDISILEPGLRMLEELTGKPVAGVVPYLHLDLDDEDSLSERLTRRQKAGLVDIAVIRLPRLSNFTDFNPLQRMEAVSLRYVQKVSELGKPDLVIIPGTKSTISDLKWLRESGLEAAILRHASGGGAVVGICGGYQMLGRCISDPSGVEGGGEVRGLGLLEADTVFEKEKSRTRVRGRVESAEGLFEALTGAEFEGYEIHMGRTGPVSKPYSVLIENGREKCDGLSKGNVWGSYVHGIFDKAGFAERFVNCLLRAKGLEEGCGAVDWDEYKQRQYDLLADGVRAALDMGFVYRVLEGGV